MRRLFFSRLFIAFAALAFAGGVMPAAAFTVPVEHPAIMHKTERIAPVTLGDHAVPLAPRTIVFDLKSANSREPRDRSCQLSGNARIAPVDLGFPDRHRALAIPWCRLPH